jgi:hypothetical protein
VNVIEKIRESALKAMVKARPNSVEAAKLKVQQAVDELQDVARSATEQSDRGIAMASVNALSELLYDYQALRDTLPESWFKVDERVTQDPDFVALAPSALVQIDSQGIWVEVKILRQYLSLMGQSVPNSRDVANLIGINTQRIAVMSVDHSPELLDLCIRCFNSYLRTTINARDPRTTYYLMNQYRLLAECLLEKQMNERVMEVMNHFQFYGQLGYEMGTTFLLEAAAHDIAEMLEQAISSGWPGSYAAERTPSLSGQSRSCSRRRAIRPRREPGTRQPRLATCSSSASVAFDGKVLVPKGGGCRERGAVGEAGVSRFPHEAIAGAVSASWQVGDVRLCESLRRLTTQLRHTSYVCFCAKTESQPPSGR